MFFPPELERWLWAMGVGLTRALPIVWMIPAFGGKNVPAQVRMGLGLALAALSLPHVMLSLPREGGPLFWMLLLAREGAVGFTVGFVGASVFRAAESAGKLIDILRGANMAEVLSPVAEERSSPLGDIFTLLVAVIFLELGGLPLVASAMARSYDAVPLDFTPMPASLAGAANLVIVTSAKLLEATLALAAPAVVALLLADLVLGAVARMAPQIPVYFVGMPLKALAGVGIVLVGLGGLQSALYGSFGGWLNLVERAFGVWR
jgi:type III secretion protein SpaR/YscT/HrcT